MMQRVLREHEQIRRADLPPHALRRLWRFDIACSASVGQTVFDWSGIDVIRAQNYVGVVQVPGLSIEILPKLTGAADGSGSDVDVEEHCRLAKKNLIFMLSVAGEIPFEERRLADQRIERLPLLEVLIGAFARALVRELRRGVPRDYVTREENLFFLRGKVLHGPNARLNAAHRERLYARYDEFLADTPLNRVLRATCGVLVRFPMVGRETSRTLYEAWSMLADVDDVIVTADLFGRIHLNRNTERFAPLLEFCRAVLLGRTPTPGAGRTRTFSLLFPMERVFEGFVGGLLRRHASKLGLDHSHVRIQSAGRSRWLVRSPQGGGRFKLRPDVLIEGDGRAVRCVLDTKWKRPKSDGVHARNGVLPADMYQLYAYAHRFDSPDNMLLYPSVPGATPKVYHLDEEGSAKRIRVEFLDLERDLFEVRDAVLEDLRRIVLPPVHDLSLMASPNEREMLQPQGVLKG